MAKVKILVVEDEKDILDLIDFNLTQNDYRVIRAGDGMTALKMARDEQPDLMILDLMLPHLDGKEVCRRIRQEPGLKNIPIIILSARAEEIDRIIGFEIGADDYVTKPFSMRELILRVQAVLRRKAENGEETGPIVIGPIEIDPERHRVEIDGQRPELTATEFKLLDHLARNAGRVQTREVLLDKVWGYNFDGYARTVDTHIRRLRQKMGSAKEYIETVRGVGYRFREED